jgi:cephalosporin hydroxylase
VADAAPRHVLSELRLYSALVPEGGYIVVNDTNINGHPSLAGRGPGPWEAVDAFLAEHPEFEPDPTRERHLFTQSPRGFLRRVRQSAAESD